MKSKIKLLAVFVVLVALVSQPIGTSAADVVKFKGRSASAFFENISGCIDTIVNVFASEQVLGNPSNAGEVFVELSQYDSCNDQILRSASGSALLTNSDFQVDANLGSATLNATVTLTDTISGSSFEVTVDLNWTATSSLGHQNSHYNLSFQGCHVNYHVNAAFRYAEAVGSVSDGTTSFTPSPSLSGTLFSTKIGDISHGC